MHILGQGNATFLGEDIYLVFSLLSKSNLYMYILDPENGISWGEDFGIKKTVSLPVTTCTVLGPENATFWGDLCYSNLKQI